MYQALYRKYRPVTFTDVISQDHITVTLKNQISSGKTAHAYLFTGSRGTGKTTCARIFAKALNCLSPVNGDPCNECEICKAADEFALTDIIEIDAASNGSVDDARQLREAAMYSPERCKYKVYIIDEVHMLSKDAFNALLKIIEEPPAHVKFIMATTELHKVLPTILSRCQRFDFRRIKTSDIAERLKYVAGLEGFSIDDDSAELIAKTADGGMRDALSILDRCAAFGENIDLGIVSEATGIAGRDHLFTIVRSIAEGDPSKALDVAAQLYAASKDMQRLCEELTMQFRNVLILKTSPQSRELIAALPSELDILAEIASKMELDKILNAIDAFGKCIERMRFSVSKRIDLEICIIRLCTGEGTVSAASSNPNVDLSGVYDRISQIENRLKNTSLAPKPVSQAKSELMFKQAPPNLTLIPNWNSVVQEMNRVSPAIGPYFNGTTGYINGVQLLVNCKNVMLKGLIGKEDYLGTVKSVVSAVTGYRIEKVLVGYKQELDRSGNAQQNDKQQKKPLTVDDVIERAKAAGVPVDIE